LEQTEPVAAILARDYVIMKVFDSNTNGNAEFLSAYPDFFAYPHLIVLDSGGKLLHSQDSEELESDSGYDGKAFAAFLKKWAPKRKKSSD
jgi:hypothetical protein